MQAHRASWLIHHGTLPELDILHECDTPPCVRPDHLYLGDDYTNQADMMRKGRGRGQFPKGSAHPYPGGRARV
jgi:HNH endonuclease